MSSTVGYVCNPRLGEVEFSLGYRECVSIVITSWACSSIEVLFSMHAALGSVLAQNIVVDHSCNPSTENQGGGRTEVILGCKEFEARLKAHRYITRKIKKPKLQVKVPDKLHKHFFNSEPSFLEFQ